VERSARKPERRGLAARSLRNVLVLAAIAIVAVCATLLFALGGLKYYTTSLSVRGYAPAHRLLRPSGTVGLALGIGGSALMILMHSYSLRKRARRLNRLGSLPRWLDFHIFCGILGPVLITFHTSFKFNGVVSVAYWSMLLVVASGFVGRYLFVRIPKSIRGQELTYAEVEEQVKELRAKLLATRLPLPVLKLIEAFEADVLPPPGTEPRWRGILFGELRLRQRLSALKRRIRGAGIDHRLLHDALKLIAERSVLLRRLAYLKKTKKLFELWHVFHMPLAFVMLLIVTLHVATAVYFGYAFGR
jgi:TRAP-type C4-dicarboxylate transport system permease small subunit